MTLADHKVRCDQLRADLAAATADLKAEVDAHAQRIAVAIRLARIAQQRPSSRYCPLPV